MTFLGWLSDPFKGLSDLQLGDEKGTLNHLVEVGSFFPIIYRVFYIPGGERFVSINSISPT